MIKSQQLATQQRQWIDIPLQSTVDYTQPFNQIQLNASFTSPSGKTINLPAFWEGGQQWCVRFSSAEVGQHTFITECSDTNNQGLHQQQGHITVSHYQGENPLLKYGGITTAQDKRHFAHEDGTPFFWLADTWWMGLSDRLSADDFTKLTNDRAEKGFNVVQIVAGLYPDMPAFDARSKNVSGFAWEDNFTQINPAFYAAADNRIQQLVAHGIAPCIVGCWGYYLERLGVEKMQLHWRNIIARWGALPVIWVSSGEQTMPWYLEGTADKARISDQLKQDWSTVMQSMHEINSFKRLVTAHPVTSARTSVNKIDLIDFEMQQTGHDRNTAEHANRALQGWFANPTMPVISGESRYEALELKPEVTSRDVRQAFWAHVINSGFSGHSYGANGIWQVNLANQPFGVSPAGNNWGTIDWETAMQLPGAEQISIAKQWIEQQPWYQLKANWLEHKPNIMHRLISKVKSHRLKRLLKRLMPNYNSYTPIASASTEDQQFVVYYTTTTEHFHVNIEAFKNGFNAYWFDPTNGKQHTIDTAGVQNLNSAAFVPFGNNHAGDLDWLLVLTANET